MPSVSLPSVLLVAVATVFALAGCATPAPTERRTVSVASATNCAQPPYPAEARQSGATGTTTLEFEVSAEGRVTRVAIIASSGDGQGHRVLDALALETLKKCAFPPTPGLLPATAKVAYVWELKE
jgi:TonB family protein